MVGVGHAGQPVEQLDAAGNDPARPDGQLTPQPVLLGVKEEQLELGQRVAHLDAIGAAARGRRLVQADLDLHGNDCRQGDATDRWPQPPVNTARRQGQEEMNGVGNIDPSEKLRGLRPHAVEAREFREKGKEDFRPGHGWGSPCARQAAGPRAVPQERDFPPSRTTVPSEMRPMPFEFRPRPGIGCCPGFVLTVWRKIWRKCDRITATRCGPPACRRCGWQRR